MINKMDTFADNQRNLYRPVSGSWLSQGQSQTPGVKVNARRRLSGETPSASIAKRKRRQGKASPRWRRRPTRASPRSNIIKSRRSRCGSPIPMGRKDHGGGDAVRRPQTLYNQGTVIKRKERWLQGHSNNTSVGQPNSWSIPAAPETPLGQIWLKRKVTPRVAGCRVREEGRYALKVSD